MSGAQASPSEYTSAERISEALKLIRTGSGQLIPKLDENLADEEVYRQKLVDANQSPLLNRALVGEIRELRRDISQIHVSFFGVASRDEEKVMPIVKKADQVVDLLFALEIRYHTSDALEKIAGESFRSSLKSCKRAGSFEEFFANYCMHVGRLTWQSSRDLRPHLKRLPRFYAWFYGEIRDQRLLGLKYEATSTVAEAASLEELGSSVVYDNLSREEIETIARRLEYLVPAQVRRVEAAISALRTLP